MPSLFARILVQWKIRALKSLFGLWGKGTHMWMENAGLEAEQNRQTRAALLGHIRHGFPWSATFARPEEDALPLLVQVFRKFQDMGFAPFADLIDAIPEKIRPGQLGACLPFCRNETEWGELFHAGAQLSGPDTITAKDALSKLMVNHADDETRWPGLAGFVRTTPFGALESVAWGQIGGRAVRAWESYAARVLAGNSRLCFDELLASGWNPARPLDVVVLGDLATTETLNASALQHLALCIHYDYPAWTPQDVADRVVRLHAGGCPLTSPCSLMPPLEMARFLQQEVLPQKALLVDAFLQALMVLSEKERLVHELPEAPEIAFSPRRL
jgi:hypothetical protein